MKSLFTKFWKWYDSHTTFNIGVASGLFTIQLIHLYWLTTTVVFLKIFGKSLFSPSPFFELVITLVDYTEIPAIFTTSLLYINELRKKFNSKSLWFLIFINSQWLHIFWITDEFVLEHFTNHTGPSVMPVWLAWIAILIDYLELPVIFDTLKKFFASLKKEGFTSALEELKED
jgi:hypothetical protein